MASAHVRIHVHAYTGGRWLATLSKHEELAGVHSGGVPRMSRAALTKFAKAVALFGEQSDPAGRLTAGTCT